MIHTLILTDDELRLLRAALHSYLRLVPRRGVEPRPRHVIGAAPTRLNPERAVPLAAQHGSPQFPFLCGL